MLVKMTIIPIPLTAVVLLAAAALVGWMVLRKR